MHWPTFLGAVLGRFRKNFHSPDIFVWACSCGAKELFLFGLNIALALCSCFFGETKSPILYYCKQGNSYINSDINSDINYPCYVIHTHTLCPYVYAYFHRDQSSVTGECRLVVLGIQVPCSRAINRDDVCSKPPGPVLWGNFGIVAAVYRIT